MAVTAKQWQETGEKVDRKARQYAKRRGVSYAEAVLAVLKADAALRRAYDQAPARDVALDELTELAVALNSDTRIKLARALRALKDKDTRSDIADAAWESLEPRLARVRLSCVPMRTRNAFSVGIARPRDPVAIIAHAATHGASCGEGLRVL